MALFAVSNDPSGIRAADEGRRGTAPFPHGLLKHSALEGLVDEINAWSNWDYTTLVSKVE